MDGMSIAGFIGVGAFGAGVTVAPRRATLVGDRLVWAYASTPPGPRPGTHPATVDLLAGFVSLHKRSDEHIRRFASKWGPLGLCEHGTLRGHGPTGQCAAGSGELLADWRAWSRRATAVLTIAQAVQRGLPGETEDWEALYWKGAWGLVKSDGRRPRLRQILHDLDVWLRQTGVGFRLTSVALEPDSPLERPTIQFHSNTLIGVIGLQLVATLGRTDGLTTCAGDNCGIPFLAPRRGGRGTNRYCPECGIRAAWRHAARRSYQRKKAKQQQAAKPEGQP